jgi:hypothetical protein
MRVKHLTEADANFGDQAAETYGKLGAVAGGALKKFASSYDSTNKDLKGKAETDVKTAAKQAEKDAKAAEKQKAKDEKASKSKAVMALKGKNAAAGAPAVASNIIFHDAPATDTVHDLEILNASELQDFLAQVKVMQSRLENSKDIFKKAAQTSSDLSADQKRDLEGRFGNQALSTLSPAASRISKNEALEQALWKVVLSSDDPTEIGKTFTEAFKKRAEAAAKHNAAVHTKLFNVKKKGAPPMEKASLRIQGTGILNLMASERQVLAHRLDELEKVIGQLENAPHVGAAPVDKDRNKFKRLASAASGATKASDEELAKKYGPDA